MDEAVLKENLARNLTELRKANGFTQSDIAEKLAYSDKSVSKWERGDGIPDILVLNKLAELYGVTLNDLVSDKTPKPKKQNKLPHLTNRIIIPLLSVGLVFLLASLVFFALSLFNVNSIKLPLVFLYAVPVACVPLIVFSAIWWAHPSRFIFISALIWSSVLCLRFSFAIESLNFLFITAAILQVIVILWWVMSAIAKKRREKENENIA